MPNRDRSRRRRRDRSENREKDNRSKRRKNCESPQGDEWKCLMKRIKDLEEHLGSRKQEESQRKSSSPPQTTEQVVSRKAKRGHEDVSSSHNKARHKNIKPQHEDTVGGSPRQSTSREEANDSDWASDHDSPSLTIDIPEDGNAEEAQMEPSSPELSQEQLNLLGSDTSNISVFGPKLQKDLTARWQTILQNGLGEEERAKILAKYLIPENCPLLSPPKLNPMVEKAVSESVARRDTRLVAIQNQIGSALTAVGNVITTLLKEGGEAIVFSS